MFTRLAVPYRDLIKKRDCEFKIGSVPAKTGTNGNPKCGVFLVYYGSINRWTVTGNESHLNVTFTFIQQIVNFL